MDIELIKMHFELFLLEHGMLEKYYKYFEENLTEEQYDDGFFEEEEFELWVSGAFFWHNKPEGGQVWGDLDDKWIKICREEGMSTDIDMRVLEFELFLLEHDALEEFEKYKYESDHVVRNVISNKGNPIMNCIHWVVTPSGGDFWSNLHDEFYLKVRRKWLS